jgi:hypothetical protein
MEFRSKIERVEMEKKSNDVESSQGEFTSGPQTLTWVAPLQSVKSYSIAEFTQSDSSPGDDGFGVFTHS